LGAPELDRQTTKSCASQASCSESVAESLLCSACFTRSIHFWILEDLGGSFPMTPPFRLPWPAHIFASLAVVRPCGKPGSDSTSAMALVSCSLAFSASLLLPSSLKWRSRD